MYFNGSVNCFVDQKTIADTPVLLEPKDLSQLSSDVQNNCSLKKYFFFFFCLKQ